MGNENGGREVYGKVGRGREQSKVGKGTIEKIESEGTG